MGRNNKHFWTYIPELGQEWEYCDLCGKARRIDDTTPQTYTFKQAQALLKNPAGTIQECQMCGGRGKIGVKAADGDAWRNGFFGLGDEPYNAVIKTTPCDNCGGVGWVTKEQLKRQIERLREY